MLRKKAARRLFCLVFAVLIYSSALSAVCAADSVSISSVPVVPEETGNGEAVWTITREEMCADVPQPLTPDGNAQLRDDVPQNAGSSGSKEFFTVQTRSGAWFYLIVDRDRETENVYFLNQVDDSDLRALLGGEDAGGVWEDSEADEVCICARMCTSSQADLTCPVCRTRPELCEGTRSPAEAVAEAVSQPETDGAEKKSSGIPGLLIFLAVCALAVIGVRQYLKKKQSPSVRGSDDLAAYDYGLEEDEEAGDYPDAYDGNLPGTSGRGGSGEA